MTCTHTPAERAEDAQCCICLSDQVRLLQLQLSIAPGNAAEIERLRTENSVLWRVIGLLGKGRSK